MPLPERKVIGVVRWRYLHRAGAELTAHPLIQNDWNHAAHQRKAQLLAMQAAQSRIRDYHAIVGALDGQRLSPYETLHRHHQSVAWLDRELATPHDGPTVVVTHFAPHRRCVAPEYENSPITPYFVSDLAWLMEKHRIALWCHGHTHTNVDFVAEGGCRVLSNQRGYQREVEWGGMKFRPRLKIQL